MTALALPANCVKSGTRWHHYQSDIAAMGELKAKQTPSDSGVVWWLFNGDNEQQAINALEASGVDSQSYRCGCAHDCCACGYHGTAFARVVGNRVIVKQTFGINI